MTTAWIDLPSGYSLTIDNGTILARNAKGKDLKSVPGQLQREVHPLPDPLPEATVTSLHDWAGAEFEQLRFAMGRATGAGFAVKGGYAVARIHEGGRLVEASYWIGADYPEGPTWTEDLSWMVDGKELPVRDVGPVAYSEGVRMARHIHAGRKVEEENK